MSAVRWPSRMRALRAAHRSSDPQLLRLLQGHQQTRWIRGKSQRLSPSAKRQVPKARLPDASRSRRAIHKGEELRTQPRQDEPVGRNTQLATVLAQSDNSDLVTNVHIPEDLDGVLPPNHPALSILGNSSLVIQRQLEMMNLVIGFEQANRYIIMDGQGQTLGYIAEEDHGIGRAMMRQWTTTHRSFTTHIFDTQQREVLRIHRPFAFINSRIRIYDPVPEGGYTDMQTSSAMRGLSVDQSAVAQVSPLKLEDMRIIGEAQQQWAPLRRKYNLFSYRPLTPAQEDPDTPRLESGERPSSDTTALTEASVPEKVIEAGMSQFAHVNEPFLSWDFTLRDQEQNSIGSVNRNFGGFAREIFTDTGVYALRMDSAAQSSPLETADGQEVARYERDATAMTLDQRAVMLATAVSIDFDYFSRHSGSGGFMPMMWPMGGGAAEGGAVGGVGAAGGTATEAGAVGAAEGAAVTGAGAMAGYEAMQRGVYGSRGSPADDASPTNNEPFAGSQSGSQQQSTCQDEYKSSEDLWGESQDPWRRDGPGDGPPPSGSGGSGDGGGSDWFSDFF